MDHRPKYTKQNYKISRKENGRKSKELGLGDNFFP